MAHPSYICSSTTVRGGEGGDTGAAIQPNEATVLLLDCIKHAGRDDCSTP